MLMRLVTLNARVATFCAHTWYFWAILCQMSPDCSLTATLKATLSWTIKRRYLMLFFVVNIGILVAENLGAAWLLTLKFELFQLIEPPLIQVLGNQRFTTFLIFAGGNAL